jgi:hypothetical protein
MVNCKKVIILPNGIKLDNQGHQMTLNFKIKKLKIRRNGL